MRNTASSSIWTNLFVLVLYFRPDSDERRMTMQGTNPSHAELTWPPASFPDIQSDPHLHLELPAAAR